MQKQVCDICGNDQVEDYLPIIHYNLVTFSFEQSHEDVLCPAWLLVLFSAAHVPASSVRTFSVAHFLPTHCPGHFITPEVEPSGEHWAHPSEPSWINIDVNQVCDERRKLSRALVPPPTHATREPAKKCLVQHVASRAPNLDAQNRDGGGMAMCSPAHMRPDAYVPPIANHA